MNRKTRNFTNSSTEVRMSISQYDHRECECVSDESKSNTCTSTPLNKTYIRLQRDSSGYTTAVLHFDRTNLNLKTIRGIISASFHILSRDGYDESRTYITVNNGAVISHNVGDEFYLDITEQFKAQEIFDIILKLSPGENAVLNFSNTIYLAVSYRDADDDEFETISVTEDAYLNLNILDGSVLPVFKTAEDPLLGISVYHIYKPHDDFTYYGRNFRLNLNETLVEGIGTHRQYIYTDTLGNEHTLYEQYYTYRNNEKNKVNLSESEMEIDIEGRIWHDGIEIFREFTSNCGLRATARLPVYSKIENAKWVDQRTDEEKQIAEQLASCKETMKSFRWTPGSLDHSDITDFTLISNERFEAFLNRNTEDEYLLTKEEALSHENFVSQGGTLTAQYYDIIENETQSNIKLLKDLYKEYHVLERELFHLGLQIPVVYLISDTETKGFNKYGELVIIQSKNGNYIAVSREIYAVTGRTRISSIYNQDEAKMLFAYESYGNLSEITNSIGETTRFEYTDIIDQGYKIKMIKPSGNVLTVLCSESREGVDDYFRRITEISDEKKHYVTLGYNDNRLLTGLSHYSTAEEIKTTGAEEPASALNTDNIYIEHTPSTTKIIEDKKTVILKYEIGKNKAVSRCEVTDGKVAMAEFYEYNDKNIRVKTDTADISCLNLYDYESFFENCKIYTETIDELNSYDDVVTRTVNLYEGNNAIQKTSVSHYTYDSNRRVLEIRTLKDGKTHVEAYSYDQNGNAVRKETYVVDEELTEGIAVKEYAYNSKGHLIYSCTYNSLDSSSKYYSESVLDEDGRVIGEYDATGAHLTTFKFTPNEKYIISERLPNGSKLAYGVAKDGKVTSITQSTEAGEENSTSKKYNIGCLTELKSGNNTVAYTYDGKRRLTNVDLNGVTDYAVFEYTEDDSANTETSTVTMKDGTSKSVTTNAHGDVTEIITDAPYTLNSRTIRTLTNEYNAKRQLTKRTGTLRNNTATEEFSYNEKGNVTQIKMTDDISSAPKNLTESYSYNSDDLLTSKTYSGDVSQSYSYTYKTNAAKALQSITVNNSITVTPEVDALGRRRGKSVTAGENKIAEERISYIKFGDHATLMPSVVRFAKNLYGEWVYEDSLSYKYDSMGNICEVKENGKSIYRYEYDALGRLTREDNKIFGKTYTWDYDCNGNILFKTERQFTTVETKALTDSENIYTYTYEPDSDRLLSYNGTAFDYDVMGYPTFYNVNLSWGFDNKLERYSESDFIYDVFGRRVSVNTYITYERFPYTCTYDSEGRLIKQINGFESYDSEGNPIQHPSKIFEFFYDDTGVFAFKYNSSMYYYRKNPQNDIIAILDTNGNIVVKYYYDAWGNSRILDANGNPIYDTYHLGNLNPFKYRSYYRDIETGLYYLENRYYDPNTGRFISPDDISYLDAESINGLNLYSYCFNDPINYTDPDGHAPWWSWALSGVQLVGGIALCFVPGMQGLGASLAIGGASGLILNALEPQIAQFVAGASSTVNGYSALSTGASIAGLGGFATVAGIGLVVVGGATIAFGANEMVDAVTGTNYIQQWTGLSDSTYAWTYLGLNVGSSAGTGLGQKSLQYRTRTAIYNPDGSVKQYRYYKKGSKLYDIDFNHGGTMNFPHYHAWLRNGTRLGKNHPGYFTMLLQLFGRIFR